MVHVDEVPRLTLLSLLVVHVVEDPNLLQEKLFLIRLNLSKVKLEPEPSPVVKGKELAVVTPTNPTGSAQPRPVLLPVETKVHKPSVDQIDRETLNMKNDYEDGND